MILSEKCVCASYFHLIKEDLSASVDLSLKAVTVARSSTNMQGKCIAPSVHFRGRSPPARSTMHCFSVLFPGLQLDGAQDSTEETLC